MKLFKRFGDKAKGRFQRDLSRYGEKKIQHVLEPVELVTTSEEASTQAVEPKKTVRKRKTKAKED